jgi:hypothetical protein
MIEHEQDHAIREAFQSARAAEVTDAQMERVTAKLSGDKSPGRSRGKLAAALVAAAMAVGVLAVSPVGAAVADLSSTFYDYLSGNTSEGQPGTDASGDPNAPPWLEDQRDQRLLAADGGYRLYVGRQANGDITFSLDKNATITDDPSSWKDQFAENFIVTFGVVATRIEDEDSDTVPIYGVSASDVANVEVHYEVGPPTRSSASDGGFVVPVETNRRPTELVAISAEGQQLQAVDLEGL